MFTVDFRFEENQTTIEFPCNEEFLSAKFDELGVEDKLKTSQYMVGTNYAALKRLVTDFADTDERIKDLKTLNYKYGIAIFEYVDMLDAAARKEPYNNNEVRFKADVVVSIVLDIIHREIRSNEIYRKISEGVVNENVQI